MKNNRKNRKLLFIRKKNDFRLGKRRFRYMMKLSDKPEDIKYILSEAKRELFKKYKLNLPILLINTGFHGDDFVKDTFHVWIDFGLK